MGRARTLPQLDLIIRALMRRVTALEARRRDQFTPVALSGSLLVNSLVPTATHAVLVTRVGASMTWWVRMTVGASSMLLTLVDDTGQSGPDTRVFNSGIYAVRFPIPDDWQEGVQHQVSLMVSMRFGGSGTILPMSVVMS